MNQINEKIMRVEQNAINLDSICKEKFFLKFDSHHVKYYIAELDAIIARNTNQKKFYNEAKKKFQILFVKML